MRTGFLVGKNMSQAQTFGTKYEVKMIELSGAVLGIKVELKQPIDPSDIVPIADTVESKYIEKIAQEKKRYIVILSGRAPVWLYTCIVHRLCHLAPVIAVFDPKLMDAVIVVSHIPSFTEGTLIRMLMPNLDLSQLL